MPTGSFGSACLRTSASLWSKRCGENGGLTRVAASRDFEELFECLSRHGVKAIVVGGHAVAFHAKPRYTKDIDLFVEPSTENAERLLEALDEFGFGGTGLAIGDFAAPGKIVQLGVEPNRVDLVTAIDGVSFEEAWSGRVSGRFRGRPVFYLGLQELKRNKREAGRKQDLADLEWLEDIE